MSNQKLLLHIPHAHTRIPAEYRDIFPDKGLLERELLRMTDHYTDALFGYDCDKVEFAVSRLVCDVERFRDPKDESMSKIGMWVCYESASDGRRLADFGDAHRQDVLKKYYDPHHERFETAVREKLCRCGEAIIIDCHSFASPALPYEPDQSAFRPDFCIGTDDFHTPKPMLETVEDYLKRKGYTVARNQPFAGTIVPIPFLWQNTNVKSVMIEVNRALYMDQATGRRNAGYGKTKGDISGLLKQLEQLTASAI